MSGAVFIDLGEEWSVVEERPVRSRRRPAHQVPLTALLLAVVLLLTGGSAVTAPPFTLLATIDANASDIRIDGGGVFIAGGAGTAFFVARYAPATGATTWRIAVPDRADALAYLAGAGVVTAWFYGENGLNRFMVLDAATGARLWESSGVLYPSSNPDGKQALTVAGDPNAPGQARYLDLRTGRAIWSRPVPAGAQIVTTDRRTPPGTAGFVVAAPDGTVTLLAEDTGAVLGRVKVDRLVPDDTARLNPEDVAMVTVSGGRLLVARRIGTPNGEVDSYDLPGLTLRWSRRGLLPGYPWPCGPNLCLSGFTGLGMIALDPATGASRWTTGDWQAAGDLAGGRMLAFGDTPEHAGILDSTTGRLLGDLGNWTVLAGSDILLATRPVRDNFRSTWIGAVDPGRAVVRPVGMLDGLSTRGCFLGGDLLVCRTLDAKVRVWRYHPGQ